MKSIERRFNLLKGKNPYWSTLICFSEAIYNQGFGEQAIHRWFKKLVDKDDYAPEDKRAILSFLKNLSKKAEDNQKSG